MGNLCTSSNQNEHKIKYSRFEDSISLEEIKNIFKEIPCDIAFTKTIITDKYIYILSRFGEENIQKYLKKIKFEKVDHTKCETEEICSICLENLKYKNKNLAKLCTCSHIFHTDCIEESLKKCGEICPLCRKGVNESVINNIYQKYSEDNQSNSSYSSYNSY